LYKFTSEFQRDINDQVNQGEFGDINIAQSHQMLAQRHHPLAATNPLCVEAEPQTGLHYLDQPPLDLTGIIGLGFTAAVDVNIHPPVLLDFSLTSSKHPS
jgi:hypothetical protein